jgi:hypothetical protein
MKDVECVVCGAVVPSIRRHRDCHRDRELIMLCDVWVAVDRSLWLLLLAGKKSPCFALANFYG